jgi:hypothetical protein
VITTGHNTTILALRTLLIFSAIALCGCNTFFDDSAYRSIGQQAPKQIEKYTADTQKHQASDVHSKETINTHLVRYGNSGLIDKIVKTTRIHCQPLTHSINATQCSYRFPHHCGSHRFSLLRFAKKEALIYQPNDQERYIIDVLSGTPKAQAGLWDQDDHIGSNASNAGFFFQNDYNAKPVSSAFNPVDSAWIIKASHKDEEEFGKLYHRAIDDIRACF